MTSVDKKRDGYGGGVSQLGHVGNGYMNLYEFI